MKRRSESMIKEKRSLEGWEFKKWFKGNWKTIKELLKVFIPMAIGWSTTNNPSLTGLITLGGKFLLDVGEYYFKEKTYFY